MYFSLMSLRADITELALWGFSDKTRKEKPDVSPIKSHPQFLLKQVTMRPICGGRLIIAFSLIGRYPQFHRHSLSGSIQLN
jgi:hypothetical protein